MNTAAAVRRELKKYIDVIPEGNLEIVRPILSFLAGNQSVYEPIVIVTEPVVIEAEPIVIETDMTVEDKPLSSIKAGRKENPENFIPWTQIRAFDRRLTSQINRPRRKKTER